MKTEFPPMLSVSDAHGRTMSFQFRPAAEPTARTIIILHGHKFNAQPSKFRDPAWNVVVPLDHFGVEQCGCWWLGEGGDFFVPAFMKRIIENVAELVGMELELYFWGSSMGGYGSLLYGMLFEAKASFALLPQTKLLGSRYAQQGMARFFAPIFGEETDIYYNDLVEVLEKQVERGKKMPLFYLSGNRYDKVDYNREQILRFAERCDQLGLNYHLEILPVAGHTLSRTIPECMTLMTRYTDGAK